MLLAFQRPWRMVALAPRVLVLLLVLAAGSAFRSHAQAQVGITTDVLTGQITGPEGEPLQNAAVRALSLENGVSRATLTDGRGRYTLIFPDGGGQYELEISRIGMITERLLVLALESEDVIVRDVRLALGPVTLGGITVTAGPDRTVAPSTSTELEGEWLALQPLDPRSIGTIAALEPGTRGLESTDSLGSGGFSVLGQRPDLNHISVDGASFGSPRGGTDGELGLPAEAVRLTRVITNSYDASQGQFSGGQISATTRGGTNRPNGSLTYSLYEPRLQWAAETPFSRAYTQHRVSGGYGGPLIRDRLFYFLSGQVRHRSQDFASLLQADLAALEQLGTHPDSVERFFSILTDHALSPVDPLPVSQELIDEWSLFGRFDYTINDQHSLMLRVDGQANVRAGTRISSLGLPHSGGNDRAGGGGIMLGVTSKFGPDFINEFRTYLSRSDSDAEPYFPVPEGRVRVTSYLEDGTRSVTNLIFGGNRSLPVTSAERSLEFSNELSWLLGARHRAKLGLLLSQNRSAQEYSSTQHGSFSFNSLEEFAANRPSSYSRSMTTSTRFGGGQNLALYLGDIWQYSRELQLTYGLRMEGSFFQESPAYNAAVEEQFERRTDAFPSELHISPRFGFTYSRPSPGRGRPSPLTLRGGIGMFRGRPPFSLYSTAMDATGLPDAQLQIVCVGDAVPIPDWSRFRQDRSEIPDRCADGETTRSASGRAPNVTVFRPGFSAPRSLRASLEIERALPGEVMLTLSGTYNQGTKLYGVRDLNLAAVPHFHLEEEGGRPVFLDPANIITSTGTIGLLGSRLHPEFGQVLELHSDLRSRSSQWVASVRKTIASRYSLRASYTYARSWDESSFSCCSAQQGYVSPSTAGDPNEAEWARSNFDRTHSLTANLGVTPRPWIEFTLSARTSSGDPYTPLVGNDVNGDGARNDRAFLFDPAVVGDPALAAGMDRLLTGASARIRECLEKQLGRIAERNSCRGPRPSSLEIRANLRPKLPGRVGERMMLSLASQNLLTGIDQLLHGSGRLRGWGQRSTPDPTLLYARGFDPESRSFRYEVNERFGNARQGRIAFGSPFQLYFEARMELGPR